MNNTAEMLLRFGNILTSLNTTRLAAVCADAHHIVTRCNSDIRVAERALSNYTRSLAGDGTVAPLRDEELVSMERQAAEVSDRNRWAHMDNSDLNALLS